MKSNKCYKCKTIFSVVYCHDEKFRCVNCLRDEFAKSQKKLLKKERFVKEAIKLIDDMNSPHTPACHDIFEYEMCQDIKVKKSNCFICIFKEIKQRERNKEKEAKKRKQRGISN